jgi:hypothetical protein
MVAAALACVLFTAWALAPVSARADERDDHGSVLSGVRSMNEIKWDSVVRQDLEVGCGAASLATILTYYFGFPATEQEIADALFAEAGAVGQADLVKRVGFSMGHIKRVAEKGGLIAEGFRVPVEKLDRIKIPVIARVSVRGYDHFLVFKGAQDGRIFVADPAFGNGSYRLAAFEKIWSGLMIGFVRRGDNPQAHELVVEAQDELAEVWGRVASRNLRSAVGAQRQSTADTFGLSLMPPVLGNLVPGLEPVFPRLLSTRTPF